VGFELPDEELLLELLELLLELELLLLADGPGLCDEPPPPPPLPQLVKLTRRNANNK
jgi:hypothetical protein